MPFPIGSGFSLQSSYQKDFRFNPYRLFFRFDKRKMVKKNEPGPAQYTRLISFMPAAIKPGELDRINILVL